MKSRSQRRFLVIGIAVLLALFLIRPGATRLKTRIASSIGMALQRRVEINTVHLHLLPQPGFDLDGFVVYDDPAFGAEPVLRAQEVTAAVRLSSLFRGRLEISRLSLTEPSLNLVRRDDGRWNIEGFLERTARIAIAPTLKTSETRPPFPYLVADRGRINFKFGPEKKPFAITDANYAFWQDSPTRWGMRLRGQPVRADLSLSDTGLLRVSGNWQRAESLFDTPVRFNLQWDGAQLGQLSKLLTGEDRGWRAGVGIAIVLEGTPANLSVRADASLQDFRRYDISVSTPLELKTHCDAQYKVSDRSLRQILCQSPVGEGSIALSGEAANLLGQRSYALEVKADKVPLQSLLAVARRAKKDMGGDLRATGSLDAIFHANARNEASPLIAFDGSGQTSDFHLLSDSPRMDLALDVVPFSVVAGSKHDVAGKTSTPRAALVAFGPDETHLLIGPLPLKLGRPSPVTVQAWVARAGYDISLKGETDIRRLLQLAHATGIPATQLAATGSAKVDLQVAGTWPGFAVPVTTGTAELHAVQAEIHGFNGTLEISSARVDLGKSATWVEGISASAAGTHWTGALSLPRPCTVPCALSFDLKADDISTDRLNEWLNPNQPERAWYQLTSSVVSGNVSALANFRASGTLTADHLVIRKLDAAHVSAKVDFDQGKLRLSDLRADVLSGKHKGEWRADFTVKPPLYSGSGSLDSASLAQLANVMHEGWISGTANAKYQIDFSGFSADDFINSAKGDLHFNMRDGVFPRILVSASPLEVRRFTGVLGVRKGEFELQDATLESPNAIYTATGKGSNRKLDFKLIPQGAAGVTVTGTLSDPRVTPMRRPQTETALKR